MAHRSGENQIRRLLGLNCGWLAVFLLLSIAPLAVRLLPVGPVILLPLLVFWRVHAPEALPLWVLLLFGFVQDALQGLPMGGSTLFYGLAALLIQRYQRLLFKESFWASWLVMMPFALLMALLYSVAMALWHHNGQYVAGLLLDGVMAIMLYPLVQPFFWPAYRQLPKTHRYAP